MKRLWLAGALGVAMLFLASSLDASATAETENGAEDIMIDAGSKGSVFFPHRRHQDKASIACETCHELFPKEPGSISRLKGEGTLKAKQVMNSRCISCHRETASAGKPAGPRSCSACHKKGGDTGKPGGREE